MSDQYVIRGATAQALVADVEEAVASGRLSPGDRLPSVRTLAGTVGVSPGTVSAAWAELRRRGIIVSRPRSGTRISERPAVLPPRRRAPLPAGVRDLSTGNPDPALLPSWQAALRRAARRAPRLYGEPAVSEALAAAAGDALTADGIDPTSLCVVSGAVDGIERVLGAHLAPGAAIAVEDPGWTGLLDLARTMGLRLVAVGIDEHGMRPEALEAALREGIAAVIVTPRGQNPTGAAFTAARAQTLHRVLAAAPDVLVIEDDHLGPAAGVPWYGIAQGRARWATVHSVAKWLGPDLRVAVLAADELTAARVQGRQALGPGWVSQLLQHVTAELWTDPTVSHDVHAAALAYAERRDALADALSDHGLPVSAASGLNLWIPVEDEDSARQALLLDGIATAAGAPYRLRAAPALRLTTATVTVAEASTLAAAIHRALRNSTLTRAA